MKKPFLLLAIFSGALFAQTAPATPVPAAKEVMPKLTVAQILDRNLSNLEREVVPAAEAMPDEKFNFAPGDKIKDGEFAGVKTFAEQVKHIAATNQLLVASLTGKPSPLTEEESDLGPKAMKSKVEIISYLKDSFEKMHKALALTTPDNLTEMVRSPFGSGQASRLGVSLIALAHTNDHYGQMVEYLRMNGIIPPASRKQ